MNEDKALTPEEASLLVSPAELIGLMNSAGKSREYELRVKIQPGDIIQLTSLKNKWYVLDVDPDQGSALLTAVCPIRGIRYHTEDTEITWENCSLRSWLNGEYYEQNFSDVEKAMIVETELENTDHPKYGTPGGNRTRDRIFLLSSDEFSKSSLVKRLYAHVNLKIRDGSGYFWTRSPGESPNTAIVVPESSGGYGGARVDQEKMILPVFSVNLYAYSVFVSLVKPSRLKRGDRIRLGKKMRWQVVDVDHSADTALLIAMYTVGRKPYHETREEITWENCTLRRWLNEEYYEKKFSEIEKTVIVETETEIPGRSENCPANIIKDRIFLPGIDTLERINNEEYCNRTNCPDAFWEAYPEGCSNWIMYFLLMEFGSCWGWKGERHYVDEKYNVLPAMKINISAYIAAKSEEMIRRAWARADSDPDQQTPCCKKSIYTLEHFKNRSFPFGFYWDPPETL